MMSVKPSAAAPASSDHESVPGKTEIFLCDRTTLCIDSRSHALS